MSALEPISRRSTDPSASASMRMIVSDDLAGARGFVLGGLFSAALWGVMAFGIIELGFRTASLEPGLLPMGGS